MYNAFGVEVAAPEALFRKMVEQRCRSESRSTLQHVRTWGWRFAAADGTGSTNVSFNTTAGCATGIVYWAALSDDVASIDGAFDVFRPEGTHEASFKSAFVVDLFRDSACRFR
jgi:hypothetical protein